MPTNVNVFDQLDQIRLIESLNVNDETKQALFEAMTGQNCRRFSTVEAAMEYLDSEDEEDESN